MSWSPTLPQLQEANAQLAEQACPHDVEMTPVQRRIEPRSADDSLSGVVRCLYFADTFLRDGEAGGGPGVEKRSGPQLAIRKWAVGQGVGKHYRCLQAAPGARCRASHTVPLESLLARG